MRRGVGRNTSAEPDNCNAGPRVDDSMDRQSSLTCTADRRTASSRRSRRELNPFEDPPERSRTRHRHRFTPFAVGRTVATGNAVTAWQDSGCRKYRKKAGACSRHWPSRNTPAATSPQRVHGEIYGQAARPISISQLRVQCCTDTPGLPWSSTRSVQRSCDLGDLISRTGFMLRCFSAFLPSTLSYRGAVGSSCSEWKHSSAVSPAAASAGINSLRPRGWVRQPRDAACIDDQANDLRRRSTCARHVGGSG